METTPGGRYPPEEKIPPLAQDHWRRDEMVREIHMAGDLHLVSEVWRLYLDRDALADASRSPSQPSVR
jgi:hypothetical protein